MSSGPFGSGALGSLGAPAAAGTGTGPGGSTPTPGPASSKVQADSQEYLEVNSVSLEWKLSNLKSLFEGSKGETKSKCVKSAFFGNGRWQIFFYPNSGHEQYCSLYLSCQPTPEECEKGALAAGWAPQAGTGSKVTDPTQVPWVREGLFKFTFEIKSFDRRTVFKAMEANDHAFSHEARNWGWAQYWRRSDAYYNNPAAKFADAFLICCTIVYSPTPPSAPPPPTRRSVPNDLLDAYASLFDDPSSSDVCFRIVKRKRSPASGQRLRLVYTIYASRKILGKRSEYFQTMFESGFAESRSPVQSTSSIFGDAVAEDRMATGSPKRKTLEDDEEDGDSDSDSMLEGGEESQMWSETDDDDDDDDIGRQSSSEAELSSPVKAGRQPLNSDPAPVAARIGSTGVEGASAMEKGDSTGQEALTSATMMADPSSSSAGAGPATSGTPSRAASAPVKGSNGKVPRTPIGLASGAFASINTGRRTPDDDVRMVGVQEDESMSEALAFDDPVQGAEGSGSGPVRRQRRKREVEKEVFVGRPDRKKRAGHSKGELGEGSRKVVVTVTDASYHTFKSLLYYLYTDSITFAPLASTYLCARDAAVAAGIAFPYPTRKDFVKASLARIPAPHGGPDAPGPCSAKAIYYLADKIGLPDLKARAFEHITRSLTPQNIPIEVFSSFTSAYDEVRKVEIDFMLRSWNEVRDGAALRTVLGSLRDGRHFPGFAEVWALLLAHLEYKPKVEGAAGASADAAT